MCQYILYFAVPLKKNRIMLYAHHRSGYVCNPGALLQYLEAKHPGQWDLVWVTEYPESLPHLPGVRICGRRSFQYFRTFIRTKVFITNDMVDENLIKKPGQLFISTWHGGGAYKKVGISTCAESEEMARHFRKWYGRLDYFVSSCRKCTTNYTEAFHLPASCFLEIGSPRNDIFWQDPDMALQQVYEFYHLDPDTQILLYAPSFAANLPDRDNLVSLTANTTAWKQVLSDLANTTGKRWVLMYRTHHFTPASCDTTNELFIDGNRYDDIQPLLLAAAMLVTDYSSCMWDFALTDRPIFVLQDIIKAYEQSDRGFFVSPQSWPYTKIRSLQEIPAKYAVWDDKDNYHKHFEQMGSFETGHACERLTDVILTHTMTPRKNSGGKHHDKK